MEQPAAHAASPPAVAKSQPTPPLAPIAGTQLDQKNTEDVRYSDALKAYPVNRYVDPNDPNVMHEGHVVYRRESSAAWNLNPNAPTVVPLGPALAVADPAKQPNPLPAELEQKMAEQNQLMASLIEQNESLAKQLAKLNGEIAEMRAKQSSFAATEEKK
ncbi:hypothetical protein DB347_25090 [Opitutaceae bacterium EW11]|nr:hypothetical protein DB347_25090 [Opitutaceae bacterium EW11]